MYFLFKSKLLVIWLGYIEMAYGFECINGTYKATNISAGKPKVELRVSNKNIYVDDEAVFTCSVRSNPSAQIFWFYEGEFITNELQRAQYKYSECNKTLTIKLAEGPDTGRYACMARNSHGETTSETVTLAVQQKAKYETIYKNASIETIPSRLCISEHKNITLKCQHNDSQGICVWKRGNKSINAEKISYCDDIMCCLTIHDFSKEDAGLYTCYMYVGVFKAEVLIPQPPGHSCNRGFVDLECINGTYKATNISAGKPKVEVRVSNKTIYVDDEVIFTCSVRSNPSAEIFWVYEGEFITNELQRAQYKYSECNKTLTIQLAEGRDTGRYACMARNSHGQTTSQTVTLAVQQKAKFVTYYKNASIETIPSRLCNSEHENITLKCQHNDSRGICVWKRGNKSMNAEKISYCDDIMCCLTIHDFSKEDAGLYTCFMYVGVFKAEVLIPQPPGHSCNGEDMQERNNEGCCTGQASKTRTHIGVWLYGVLALIMAMVCL